ncbi:MAG TPA: hypothetical protein VF432_22775 [Thermoanaerobaculia bacterium]
MITAAALLLASMLYAGPEREVSPPVPGHIQFHGAVSRAGDATLTAWVDGRWDVTSVMARVNDGAPFLVATEASARWVRVATDGSDFVVLWTAGAPTVYVRRVLRDGTMPAPAVEVALQGFFIGPSCVTWNGAEYVAGFVKRVKWNPRGEIVDEIWARRIARDGTLGGEELRIAGGSHGVACASTPETTLFVWGFSQIEGATLTRGGTISGKFPVMAGEAPAVASNGTGFLVAAYDRYTYGPSAAVVTRAMVSELGTVTEKPAFNVEIVPYGLEAPAVGARPNGGYAVAYGTTPLRLQALDAAGNPEGTDLLLAREAAFAAITAGTIVYQRDTANFAEPRWRLFARTLSEIGRMRRRTTRQ